MTNKHTPEPWKIVKGQWKFGGVSSLEVFAENGIAICRLSSYLGDATKPTGKLIAAAPDMAEALRDARAALGRNEFERESTRRRIDAVLAKAGL